MNSKLYLPLLGLALLISACESKESPTSSPATKKQAELTTPAPKAKETHSKIKGFGAKLDLEKLTPLTAVFAAPEKYEGKTVLVEGYVQRACTKKGCWMEIALDEEKSAQRCRVKFKDYAFFVPRDSAGSDAKVQGSVQVNTVSKERVDHLEAEGARFAHKQVDGTALEVQLVATGVELKKGS